VTGPPNPSVPLKQNEYSPSLSDKKKKKKKKESVDRLKRLKNKGLERFKQREFSQNLEVSQISRRQKKCLGCGCQIPYYNKSGYCPHCFPKFKLHNHKKKRKKRRVCANCGAYLGERNISGFCKNCRKGHRKPIFDAQVRVIFHADGSKGLVGGWEHRGEGIKKGKV